MISIFHEWFSLNRPLIFFLYGQVFFVLGLAISLTPRRYSRLNLARSLPWLAGFGFLHSLNEWGDVFIPIQSQFLGEPFVAILGTFQHILLAISFTSLFQFGIELLLPFPVKWRWLRFLPAGFFMIWLIGPFWIGLGLSQNIEEWHNLVNVIARYGLCLPGGFISAIGLLHQTQLQINFLGLPKIGRTLKIAAGALVAYGILGGLIVPAASFFPANIVNVNTFTAIMIVPPPVFRSLAGLVLAITIIRAMEVFDIKTDRMIRQMEESQVVAIDHEQIARDLHDGALQQVYAAGLLAQSLQRQAKGSLADGIKRLVITINQAIDQLRAFLPLLQPEPKSIELVKALEPIIEDARQALPVETFWDTPNSHLLSPEQTSHVVAFTAEALSNAIRHSQTKKIEIFMEFVEGHLRLTVRDYGKGLPPVVVSGYGLRNMRDRSRLLCAELKFDSPSGKGTRVTLDLPVEKLDAKNSPVNS